MHGHRHAGHLPDLNAKLDGSERCPRVRMRLRVCVLSGVYANGWKTANILIGNVCVCMLLPLACILPMLSCELKNPANKKGTKINLCQKQCDYQG